MVKSANIPDKLTGQLLIAMPGLTDALFGRSIVYLCAHSDEGAMGLVINKPASEITFQGLLAQVEPADEGDAAAPSPAVVQDRTIHIGGPVETNRGFVLHSLDYINTDMTLSVADRIGLTATLDVLHALRDGRGPDYALIALGYAGWSPGQLEDELQENGWLNCPADLDLIFNADPEDKYDQALRKLGIDPSHLSTQAGHA